ncbi:MAG: biotin transporter BioY [Paracoccaceae bacterium]
MTLVKAIAPSQSLAVKAAMVILGSAFIAIAAQISVPMLPVPMTLQTLAILIVGLSYGARLGSLTVAAYLAEGAAGLPVFANFHNGVAFTGPTAGFLVGFLLLAFVAGLAADRGARGVVAMAVAGLVASALLYIPGVVWPMVLAEGVGIDASQWGADSLAMVWQYYVGPFLIGDAVKAVIAALVVAGGWAALKGRKV